MAKKSKAKAGATAFIHGRTPVKSKKDKTKVTSIKFDKILGNLAKLGIKVLTLYTEPEAGEDVAAFKVTVEPVTEKEYNEALAKVFAA